MKKFLKDPEKSFRGPIKQISTYLKESEFLKKSFLVIFGLTLGAVGVEIYLRTIPQTTLKFYDDDVFGSALVPNQKEWFVSSTKEYRNRVEVNSHGWPDVEHTFEKSKDVYRILIIGNSFVENFQVPFENRFFRQLQQRLGPKYEVIAMGRGNTRTSPQYLILKNYGLAYQPDLVIHLFLTANDIKNNSPVLQNDPYLPYFEVGENENLKLIPLTKRSQGLLATLKEFLKTFRLIELVLSARQSLIEYRVNRAMDGYPLDYHVYDVNYNGEFLKAWKVTKKLILESKKVTEEAGAKYILVTLANNEQVNEKARDEIYKNYPAARQSRLDFEKPEKIMMDFCKSEKIAYWQMLSYFKEHLLSSSPGLELYYFYDGHWNQRGTNLAADFLFRQLKDYFSIK